MPCLTARFTGRWLAGRSAGGVLRERAYGQNDVLQPYDLPVTRGGVCARLGAEATDYGLRAARKPKSLRLSLGDPPRRCDERQGSLT